MSSITKTEKTCEVKCRVRTGMFSHEFYVIVGEDSYYVNRQNVSVEKIPEKYEKMEGKVTGRIVKEESDRYLVEVNANEAVVVGRRTWVPKSDCFFE